MNATNRHSPVEYQKDFFISYNTADKNWAEWIAYQLEGAGYSVLFRAWDFRPGSNYVLELNKALSNAQRILAVLSLNYLKGPYTQPEWAAVFGRDPTGEQGTLLPTRVEQCEVTGLLRPIILIDLFGMSEEVARKTLLDGVQAGRVRPPVAPRFPGQVQYTVSLPLRFPGSSPAVTNVPYERDTLFIGRENELETARAVLKTGQPVALTQSRLVHNLGSIGKTQTANEYAHRYQSDYQVTLWVSGHSLDALTKGFTDIAGLLKLPERNAPDQNRIIDAVKRWLQTQTGWLLVLDDVKDPALLKHFIPQTRNGHILLTTRIPSNSIKAIAYPIELEKMKPDEEERIQLLSRTVGGAISGTSGKKVLTLYQPTTIGRAADNTMILPDSAISSHHAQVQLDEQGFSIKDLGTVNGTTVDGEKLAPNEIHILTPGETISLGSSTLTFNVSHAPHVQPDSSKVPAPQHVSRPLPTAPVTPPNVYASSVPPYEEYQPTVPLHRQSFEPFPIAPGTSYVYNPEGSYGKLTEAKKGHRSLWIVLGVFGTLVLIGAIVLAASMFVHTPPIQTQVTPTTQVTVPPTAAPTPTATPIPVTPTVDVSGATSTIATFCEFINSGATQQAYNLTSSNYQSQHSVSEFTNQFNNPDLFNGGCLYNRPTIRGSNVAVPLIMNRSNPYNGSTSSVSYTATLIKDPRGGGWVIDSIQS